MNRISGAIHEQVKTGLIPSLKAQTEVKNIDFLK
jgi:hypothetical protein